ncbi:MAG TPA: hypothetical protein VGB64_03680 [Actinomycetota bacterium]
MKRSWIALSIAIVAALPLAANANHGGAHSPDLNPSDDMCQIVLAGHGSCSVTNTTASGINLQASHILGVPTADGWRVAFDITIVNNDTGQVIRKESVDVTHPYAYDYLGFGVPLPYPPFDGRWSGGPGEMTSATCIVDVIAGIGGLLECRLPWVPDGGLPLPI